MAGDGESFDELLRAARAGDRGEVDRILAAADEADGTRARLEMLLSLRARSADGRAAPAPADAPDLPFERLGDYRVLRRLGEGGMGRLYLAEQEPLGRRIALKLIRSSLLGSVTVRERFRREARSAARLQHPNLVTVHAAGEEDGVAYIAMEYVDGRPMDELIREARDRGRPIETRRVVRWGARLARALAHAHDRGVIHRDVKPGNVLITAGDEPKLVDFGIARDAGSGDGTITRAFTGSLPYAAPEQLAGRERELDRRTDLYALAVTLYEAVTGRLPIPGSPALEALLTGEPVPPRRHNPDLSRDLELVLLKALEKSPSRRYPDAASFAEDLEAILALRPVSARPPGGLDRARRWARRRPRSAAVLASAAIAALLFAGYLVYARHREANRRRGEAARLVDFARSELEEYRRRQAGLVRSEGRAVELQRTLGAKYLSPEEDRLLEESESRIARARREREEAYHRVLERLRRAQQLDPGVSGAERVRTDLYMQRWREARETGDPESEAFFRDLVEEHDREGRLTEELRGSFPVSIDTRPAGATVYYYRLVEQASVVDGGERRYVPAPPRSDGSFPRPPGSFALRVVRGPPGFREGDLIFDPAGEPIRGAAFALATAGGFRRGDRILAVDGHPVAGPLDAAEAGAGAHRFRIRREGEEREIESEADREPPFGDARALAEGGGVPAVVYHRGRLVSVVLPQGLVLRATAIPVFPVPEARLGATPTGRRVLPRGRWLFLVRREGYRDLRFAVDTREMPGLDLTVPLIRASNDHPGFVPVVEVSAPPAFFWMQEREVTSEEYLEFLNDPATRREIDRAERPVLFPREPGDTGVEGYWERDADGRFRLPADWRPDLPVLGVSWYDAVAYARWRTRRARNRGEAVTFHLPTYAQWIRAANSLSLCDYPFGDHFRPKWVCSCYSRPRPEPEGVLSYPIDESVCGVFDLCGSAMEWLDDEYDTEGRKRLAGGSWGLAKPDEFTLYGQGRPPDRTSGSFGFRLALEEDR